MPARSPRSSGIDMTGLIRPRPASLLLLAVCTSACATPTAPGDPTEPWRPEPMAAPNTFVSDVDAVCRPDLQFRDEELASMSVTAADVRGDEVALLVYTSDVSAGAVCWRGLGDVLPHVTSQWNGKFGPADLRMRDLGRRDLCLWFNKGHSRAPEGRDFAHAVWRAGTVTRSPRWSSRRRCRVAFRPQPSTDGSWLGGLGTKRVPLVSASWAWMPSGNL